MPAAILHRIRIFAAALLLAAAAAGPSIAAPKPLTDVILIRGFMGVFSMGLDDLAAELRRKGVRTKVIGHLGGSGVVHELAEAKARKHRLVIVGHSFGGDAAMNVARMLASRQVRVDLVVTLDPTQSGPVSPGVGRYVNYYLSGNVLGQAVEGGGKVRNIDIRDRSDLVADHVGHWNMTDNPRIKKEVASLVLRALAR